MTRRTLFKRAAAAFVGSVLARTSLAGVSSFESVLDRLEHLLYQTMGDNRVRPEHTGTIVTWNGQDIIATHIEWVEHYPDPNTGDEIWEAGI
jgi:hypothetical protein